MDNLSYDLKALGAKKVILRFIIKIAILFTAWFITYNAIIGPSKVIDRPLTNFISSCVVDFVNLIVEKEDHITWSEKPVIHENYLLKNNKVVLRIAYSCDGIDLMFTYISIILLLPGNFKRKTVFTTVGVILIVFANIARITALYFIFTHYKSAFDLSHHYIFTILMDILIFWGWLLFINKKKA